MRYAHLRRLRGRAGLSLGNRMQGWVTGTLGRSLGFMLGCLREEAVGGVP